MIRFAFRSAKVSDAAEILSIYAPYVLNTAISFECGAPSLKDFRMRIANTLKKFPYLVAIYEGKIVGYAYASAFHPRKAYEHCVELSIYIKPEFHRIGLGNALYQRLEILLKNQGIFNLYACIAKTPRKYDPHLTNASISFHKKKGFRLVGTFKQCGCKFGLWYDMVWMEKIIIQKGFRDNSKLRSRQA
ncbi:MAG: N-acetyltransferase family protein [Fibrobacteraceae bacterium]|nr:N-acetyltransferase family protein [Fibrobacteraceae bacterium]